MINVPGNPSNYPANVRMIEDGDKRGEVNLAAAVEDLADRTAFISARMGGALATGGLWYPIPIGVALRDFVSATPCWIDEALPVSSASETLPALMTNGGITTATAHAFVLPLSPFLPSGGLLRGFEVTLYGSSVYSDVPEHKPQCKLYDYDAASGVVTKFVGPAEGITCHDMTPSPVSYKLSHQLGVYYLSGGDSPVIDLFEYRNLFLRVESEYGTNAANNTFFLNPRCLVARDVWS